MKALLLSILLLSLLTFSLSTSKGATAQSIHVDEAEVQLGGPKLGGFIKLNVKSAELIDKYLKQKLEQVKGLTLVQYHKQVVNGWNHLLKYEDENKNVRKIIVYQSAEGQLSISSNVSDQQQM